MASQMRCFNQAAVICSCDVLSHQIGAIQSAEYSGEVNCNKVRLEDNLLVPVVFTDTESRKVELLYTALLKFLLTI